MADGEQPEGADEGEVLELDALAAPEAEDQPEDKPEGADDEEVIVSFGDEAAPASEGETAPWVRDLRKRNRELERRVADFEKSQAAQVPEAGPKPDRWEDGFEDDESYDAALLQWHERTRQAEAAKSEAEKAQDLARERWEAELKTYAGQKDDLASKGVKDFDVAEEEVLAALSDAQKAIILQGAENKGLLVLALGKSPQKLKQLASIVDPIKFAFAAARLEGQTRMERRPATSPEGRVNGSAPLAGSTDKTLERLEKEASKPGADRSALIRYKREKGLL